MVSSPKKLKSLNPKQNPKPKKTRPKTLNFKEGGARPVLTLKASQLQFEARRPPVGSTETWLGFGKKCLGFMV